MEGEVAGLSSDSYSLTGGKKIPNGADLKSPEYMIPGNYYCSSNDNASTLINCPVSSAFTMKVEHGTGDSYPRQTFTTLHGNVMIQGYDPYNHVWSFENQLITKNMLPLRMTYGLKTGTLNNDGVVVTGLTGYDFLIIVNNSSNPYVLKPYKQGAAWFLTVENYNGEQIRTPSGKEIPYKYYGFSVI